MSTRVLGDVRVYRSRSQVVPEAGIADTSSRSTSRDHSLVVVGMLSSDAVCALVGQATAHVVVHGWVAPSPGTLLQLGLTAAVWLGIFHAFGLYEIRRLSAFEEFRRVVAAACVATTVLIVIRASADVTPQRRWLGLTWVAALGLELLARRWWRSQVGRLRGRGHLLARTAIVGNAAAALRLASTLEDPRLGFRLVGHVATGPGSFGGLPSIGSLDQLSEVIRLSHVECLFVTGAVTTGEMSAVRAAAAATGVEVRIAADLADVSVARLSVQSLGDVLAVCLRPVRLGAGQAVVKRVFDVCVGSILLVVSLPLMAVAAVTVRLTSPGPAIFRQARVTKGGRTFQMLKFRTMTVDDRIESELDLSRPFFKQNDDPRITPVGRVLRKFSLDELPQLWQVVRGDLSLVGPRPLPAVQVSANEDLLSPRHQVRAGVTGWWQVNGRSAVSPAEALRLDLYYIENWSLSLDFFILLKTMGAVVSRRGAC